VTTHTLDRADLFIVLCIHVHCVR